MELAVKENQLLSIEISNKLRSVIITVELRRGVVTRLQLKKYRALNDRVARAVGAYGRAEVLVYLRSIAYLSHA